MVDMHALLTQLVTTLYYHYTHLNQESHISDIGSCACHHQGHSRSCGVSIFRSVADEARAPITPAVTATKRPDANSKEA